MAKSAWKQLGLLLWKNFTLQKRRPFAMAFEILLPVMFMLILVGIRHATLQKAKDKCVGGCEYESFKASTSFVDQFPPCTNWTVAYYPSNASDIMTALQTRVETVTLDIEKLHLHPFDDGEELVDFLLNRVPNSGCKFGVNFTQMDDEVVEYQFRFDATPGGFVFNNSFAQRLWLTEFTYPPFQTIGPRDDDSFLKVRFGSLPGYVQYAFVAMQHAMDRSIAQVKLPSDQVTEALRLYDEIELERMPYPQYLDDNFIYAIKFGLPLLIMLSMLFSALTVVRNLVHEKERRLKESMKMMGLANWAHWSAWFIQSFVFLLITMVLIVAVVKGGGVLGNSDPTVLLVFFLSFAIATIMLCFMVSTFFSKASSGAAAGGIIWFSTYIPYFFIGPRYDTMSFGAKQASCFVSTSAMAIGAQLIGEFEGRGDGVQWKTIAQPVSTDDPFTFLTVIAMLLFDAFIYGLVTWYVEAVFPGEFGIPQPFYFPFLPRYWCGSKSRQFDEDDEDAPLLGSNNSSDAPELDPKNFEQEPENIHCGIDIRNLRKVFPKRVAVAGTNLRLYEGQITALLGHNGAGKTTTMNMLTGLYPPTSGTAFVSGHDIRYDIDKVRSNLGICPQHDVLFDTLTVEEHLRFFCHIKGVPSKEIQRHVDEMIEALELPDKRHAASKTLSGGMKRKLSCAIAIIGGSKVVILDEPTSGMDPSARRATWDLISKFKDNRTILLSTHFLDEADLLGDRIAIMSDGIVECCGSSMFLKSRFGFGYSMIVSKNLNCKVDAVLETIREHVPEAKLERNLGADLSIQLPRKSSSKFPEMLRHLESNGNSLGIGGYGISVCTLEEVFLRVSDEAAQRNEGVTIDFSKNIDGGEDAIPLESSKNLNSGMSLKIQQLKAMIIKRMLHSKRNVKAVITQLLLPLVFTLIALILAKTYPSVVNEPPRSLTDYQSHYGQTQIVYTPEIGSMSDPNHIDPNNMTLALSNTLASVVSSIDASAVKANDQENWLNLTDYLLKKVGQSQRDVAKFNKENVFAFEFEPEGTDEVTPRVFFNGQAYHSVSEAVNLASRVIFNTFGNLTINYGNYPLPRNALERAQDIQDSMMGFFVSFCVVFGMSFLASSFVLFLVAERSNSAKHIQFVSGVDFVSYWSASYLWDVFNFLVPTAGCMILFAAFSVEEFAGERLGYVLMLFVLYGLSIIPVMFIASFLFKNPSSAYTYMTIFNIITGLAAMLTVSILGVIEPDIANQLKKAFLFMPNYCFGQGLSDLFENYQAIQVVEQSMSICRALNATTVQECCQLNKNDPNSEFQVSCNTNFLSFSTPGIGLYLVCMVAEAIVYFGIVLAIEARVIQRLFSACFPPPKPPRHPLQEDEDVSAERERVGKSLDAINSNNHGGVDVQHSPDVLMVDNLSKIYRSHGCCSSNDKLAVDRLCFGVPHGECFGLLGVNGAGKTTTFRMLTGDEITTGGTAKLDGFDIHKDMMKVRQRIGYCPQFDGLIELMTGRELLTMYARLRGLPEKRIPIVVQQLLQALSLTKYSDVRCGTYSGGNKRKLSTAVALCGPAPIVYLDEPTTGMDPGSRRFLWDALIKGIQGGRSIILTSHSMEECEALCTRLAIMVNGRFQCIGSPQHLKSRFGQGLTLIAKVPLEFKQAFCSTLKETFPESRLKDEHQMMAQFELSGQYLWSQVFEFMESCRSKFDLVDYSVSQTTLEQIFLDFAKHQHEDLRQSQA